MICYNPPGGTSLDGFLQHMLRLGDFAWELRSLRLEQLLRAPHSAAARVHQWLTAAEGDCPATSSTFHQGLRGLLTPGERHSGVSHRGGSPPLPEPAWGFLKAPQRRILPTAGHRTQFMTAWEAHIVGAEWAHKWSRWCATTRTRGTPATQYAPVPLEGWGPHTRPRPTVIRGAGPERPLDAETTEKLRPAPEPHTGWCATCPCSSGHPSSPGLVLHTANILQAVEIRTWRCEAATLRWLPPEEGGSRLTVAHYKKRGAYIR